MSEPWVIDTNVGVVANDRIEDEPNPPRLPQSISACTVFLRDVMRAGGIAVDDAWEIRRADFQAAGITVNFLCPEEIKANSDRKHGPDTP